MDAVATEPAIFVVLIAEPDRGKKMLDVIKPVSYKRSNSSV